MPYHAFYQIFSSILATAENSVRYLNIDLILTRFTLTRIFGNPSHQTQRNSSSKCISEKPSRCLECKNRCVLTYFSEKIYSVQRYSVPLHLRICTTIGTSNKHRVLTKGKWAFSYMKYSKTFDLKLFHFARNLNCVTMICKVLKLSLYIASYTFPAHFAQTVCQNLSLL